MTTKYWVTLHLNGTTLTFTATFPNPVDTGDTGDFTDRLHKEELKFLVDHADPGYQIVVFDNSKVTGYLLERVDDE